MSIHFLREIETLKKRLLLLSGRVEENVRRAVNAVDRRDADLARTVIDTDIAIDEMEVTAEEDCLKILALHQPVAIDLRFVIAVLKINNDLERIGDLAVNIAKRALVLAGGERLPFLFDFLGMADKVQDMLKRSLDALVNMDTAQADIVRSADDSVDTLNRQMFGLVAKALAAAPQNAAILLHMLGIARHLERIADHATNIAEDVIYMVKGEIIRHHADENDRPARTPGHS